VKNENVAPACLSLSIRYDLSMNAYTGQTTGPDVSTPLLTVVHVADSKATLILMSKMLSCSFCLALLALAAESG
jgi:hypothetical protein